MKNILITGASGFVGSHLVEFLQSKDYQLFALVRKKSNTQLLKQLGVQLVTAELTNLLELNLAFAKLKKEGVSLDIVIHCAAATNAKNLEGFMQVNCFGTQNLLEVLEKNQPSVERFIFISSLAASGPTTLNQVIPLEASAPITHYGESKLAAETIVKKSKIPHVILRPTAVYGPREKDIFTMFSLVNNGLHPNIGSHRQQLTFVYVIDLVEIIAKSITTQQVNQTYFVSDGNIYEKKTLGDLVSKQLKKKTVKITIPLWLVKGIAFISQTIHTLQNKLSPLNLQKYKELKAQSWVCEVEGTFKALEIYPKYNLEQGVAETTKWYLQKGWLK